MAKYRTVDEYLAQLPADRRATMEGLRTTIAAAAPVAVEAISYNMPAFRLDGRFLVSYESFKHHISLFAWSDEMLQELGDDLRPYAVGKGTIRFPAGAPIPLDLVRRVVEVRIREVSAQG